MTSAQPDETRPKAPRAKAAVLPAAHPSQAPKTDHLEDKLHPGEHRQEALLDEAIEESFPASDPPSAKHIT